MVALVGQSLSVALLVSDLDQDALTGSADGLPGGAQITTGAPHRPTARRAKRYVATNAKGRYLVVRTDERSGVGESNESNNAAAVSSLVSHRASDLQVSEVRSEPTHYSGEETTITWTVSNFGAAVWAGTRSWVDTVYLSTDPSFIPTRATPLGSFTHANLEGLAAGASYTTSAKVRLPVGAQGQYTIYVITDADPENRRAQSEVFLSGDNELAKSILATTVFEGARNDNNLGRGSLTVVYREPDLHVDGIVVSEANPASGQPLTVTWTVTNRGTRATRSGSWYDGLYLSRDASLDSSDYALIDRGSPSEAYIRLKAITVPASDLAAGKFLVAANLKVVAVSRREVGCSWGGCSSRD